MTEASLFDTSTFEADPSQGTIATTQSLYRKYRPTTFADDDLVGQEHVVNTLRNAIALGRIAHAYLFCGPRGTGKTTTARLLAKAVNCLDPDPRARPCNACASCVAITTGATTDVIEIDAASNRGIDDIRDLRERVKYAPTQLKTKFYIVDEAHQITGAAANAFLKTLEEPPAHTKFVLATTDPEELLQTIVSRCQRFDFRRINLEAMVSRLRSVADREQITIDDDALPVIARQATGSLRDALGMLDQVAVYQESATAASGPITAEAVRSVLGVSRNERVEALVAALADRDPAAGLREVSAAVDAGDDIRQLGRQFVTYLRLLLLERAGGEPDADDRARELAARFSLAELADLIRRSADLDARAKRATFPQLPLELAIVEGASRGDHRPAAPADVLEPAPEIDSPRPRSEPGEAPSDRISEAGSAPASRTSLRDRVRGTASSPSPMSPDAPRRPASATATAPKVEDRNEAPQPNPSDESRGTPVSTPGSLALTAIIDLWPKIRADVKAVNRRIEALLQQVDPAAVNGTQIVLASPYEFHRNRVNSDEVRQVVEQVIGRLVGGQVQVSCLAREEALKMAGTASTIPVVEEPGDPPTERADSHQAVTDPEGERPVTAPTIDVADAEGATSNRRKDDEARLTAAKNIFDAVEVND